MLDERKKKILQAVIDEYIQSAEPVSSGSIAGKYSLNYSSATIRNEMADLEKEGYLDKPHTSSGRVPSALGYRLYVDELLKEDNISLEEIKYIKSKLETRVNEMEELTKIATNTLSEITHYTTVAIGPKNNLQNIEEVKFVLLGKRMLMAIILTDTGIIKETIIKFDEDISEEQVETLTFIFNNLIDTKDIVVDLLNTGFAKDINVYIGDENDNEQLKDFSIITFKHRYKDRDLGTIGIIGPKRMDYSKVISVMKYISKKLNGE